MKERIIFRFISFFTAGGAFALSLERGHPGWLMLSLIVALPAFIETALFDL